MRNFIIGFITACLLLCGVGTVLAKTSFTDISGEALWNRVFDSTNNKINVVGI